MEDSGTFGLAANQCQVGADDVATAIMSMARGAEREFRVGEEAASDVEVGLAGALWLMPAGIFTRRNLVVGAKGLVLGTAMVVLLRAWGSQEIGYLIVAGAACYVPLALWWGVLPREDLAHLWHALRKGR